MNRKLFRQFVSPRLHNILPDRLWKVSYLRPVCPHQGQGSLSHCLSLSLQGLQPVHLLHSSCPPGIRIFSLTTRTASCVLSVCPSITPAPPMTAMVRIKTRSDLLIFFFICNKPQLSKSCKRAASSS